MIETTIVLAGGLSHERDVSLRSGRRVTQALRDLGHRVVESDVDAGLLQRLADTPDAVVFPLLHGGAGEDGALRDVLTIAGVPYVGSDGPSSRLAFDKAICNPIAARAGLRVPRQFALPHDMFRELGAAGLVRAVSAEMGFPLVVKPARAGSAMGFAKVADAVALPAAMVAAYSYGDVALIQEYVEGVEVAVTVVDVGEGARALPAVEIQPASGVYDYSARYTAGETLFRCPAHLTDAVAAACAEMALAAHHAFGLSDLSRTDIIVRDDQPVFLEVNVAPGMTETSLVPLAIESDGLEFGELCAQLVAVARSRGPRDS